MTAFSDTPMKFVVNRYSLTFHIVKDDPLPISGVRLESLPFGAPAAFTMREIWTLEISHLHELLSSVHQLGMSAELSVSAFWSGDSPANARKRLFGLALMDDHNLHLIDPQDRPVLLAARGKSVQR